MAEISLSEYSNQPKSTPNKPSGLPHFGILIAALVVVAVSGFFIGVQYQKGKTPNGTAGTASASQTTTSGRSGFGGGLQRGDRAFGTVSSVSSTSITIQTRSGTASTYTLMSSTTVTNSGQSSSVSSIQTGDIVILTLNSSNTQDVTSIMLNPSFGGGAGASSPSGSDTTQTDNVTGTAGA